MTNEKENVIGNIISHVASKYKKEQRELYKDLHDRYPFKSEKKSLKQMHEELYHPFEEYTEEVLRSSLKIDIPEGAIDELVFIMQNYDFVEQQFGHFISECEGSSCYYDKVGWVMNELIKHISLQKPSEFDRKHYWIPSFCFGTVEEIYSFFRNIHSLYYGNLDTYLMNATGFYGGIEERRKDYLIASVCFYGGTYSDMVGKKITLEKFKEEYKLGLISDVEIKEYVRKTYDIQKLAKNSEEKNSTT